jgi:hypothetical protein
MTPFEFLKKHSADATLLVVLLLAAMSQVSPSLSAALTILACFLVGLFAVVSYLPRRPKRESVTATIADERTPDVARSEASYPFSICRFEPWHTQFAIIPNFGKRSVVASEVQRMGFVHGAHHKRNQLVDLTDALPDDCTVRIGLVEIRLKDGETSVKMRTSRDPAPAKRKYATVFLDPMNVDHPEFSERQEAVIN